MWTPRGNQSNPTNSPQVTNEKSEKWRKATKCIHSPSKYENSDRLNHPRSVIRTASVLPYFLQYTRFCKQRTQTLIIQREDVVSPGHLYGIGDNFLRYILNDLLGRVKWTDIIDYTRNAHILRILHNLTVTSTNFVSINTFHNTRDTVKAQLRSLLDSLFAQTVLFFFVFLACIRLADIFFNVWQTSALHSLSQYST